jgi:hypothetical protein
MAAKREPPEREQANVDGGEFASDLGSQNFPDDKISAPDPAFRPLPGGRPFRDQPASREPTVAWQVAASHYRLADDQRNEAVHRRGNGSILLIVVFAVGLIVIVGVGTTSLLVPDRSQSIRIPSDAGQGAGAKINLHQIWPALARAANRIAAPLSTSPERVGKPKMPSKPPLRLRRRSSHARMARPCYLLWIRKRVALDRAKRRRPRVPGQCPRSAAGHPLSPPRSLPTSMADVARQKTALKDLSRRGAAGPGASLVHSGRPNAVRRAAAEAGV